MDDLDLSHLLDETATPQNGPARVRQIVARRRRRNRIAGTTLAVLAVAGLGSGLLYQLNKSDDVLLQREAGSTATTVETTTTTEPDPLQRYVGLTHTSNGSGLPLKVSMVTFGLPADKETPDRGDFIYYWMRDEVKDMVWMENVTSYDPRTFTITSTVAAVFAVDPLAPDESACLGTCFHATTKEPERNVVAVFKNQKVFRAWTVDALARTMTPSPRKNFVPTSDEVDPTLTPTTVASYPNPGRPALYGLAATCKPDACAWYQQYEQIEGRGGGGPENYLITNMLYDAKEDKNVLVWHDGTIVRDILVVDAKQGLVLPPYAGPTYKGQTVNNLVFLRDGKRIARAWLMDTDTHKFVEVNPSDVGNTD